MFSKRGMINWYIALNICVIFRLIGAVTLGLSFDVGLHFSGGRIFILIDIDKFLATQFLRES